MKHHSIFLRFQILSLAVGSFVAWYTVIGDFVRFYETYGTIFRIKNCVIPNPVTTPCFYGAIAFVVALIWSILIYQKKNGGIARQEKHLWWLLLGSTIFAWSNFGYELYRFYAPRDEPFTSCSGIPIENPFLTSCFYGSVLFLFALISLSMILKKK